MKGQIEAFLQDLDLDYRWLDHPPVFTVAESLEKIEDKRPIKNILLAEKGTDVPVLVIIAGEQRVDSKRIASELGTKKLQFADEKLLEASLGVRPGAVSIFGLLHSGSKDVQVVIDKNLLTEPELGFHPNDNTATIFLPGAAIKQILHRTGHAYKVLDLY